MSPIWNKRRSVLIATSIGAALVVGSALILWNILPSSGLGATLGLAPAEYEPPEEFPIALPEARLDGVTVSVIEEAENVAMTAEGQYATELSQWRDWMTAAGARLGTPDEADVLIVPLGECLGGVSRELIERHMQGGGGIVTSGLLGARDGTCQLAPDTLLSNLLGDVTTAVPEVSSPSMVLLGETMLAAGAPAGARINLDPAPHIVFRGPKREIYFSTYDREPATVGGEAFFDGAAARAVAGPGRIVAFGFGISEISDSWSQKVGRIVVRNAVQWAAGRPVLQIATWPAGYPAAAVIAQDVEADYANAAGAVDLIEAAGIPTTYFIVGQLAERNPFVTRSMVREGELASHSYHHRPMDSFADEGQREELALAKATTEEFAGGPIGGFRPPEERFTVETLRAWAEIGGDYFFASDHGRSPVPVMVPFGPDSLVFLGRVVDDDFALLSRNELRDRGEMMQRLMEQIDEVVAYRGAYLFSYHSHIMAQEQLMPVLSALIEVLKGRSDIWLATAGDVAGWWRARGAIDLVPNSAGTGADLRNAGRQTFANGRLLVDLPDGTQESVAIPEIPPGAQVTVGW